MHLDIKIPNVTSKEISFTVFHDVQASSEKDDLNLLLTRAGLTAGRD
jgi:hypothetical protein